MGELVHFIPKSEREWARLIREARAIYNSIFPPADPVDEHKASIGRSVSGAHAGGRDEVLLP